MQALNSPSNGSENDLEEVLEERPRRRLNEKSVPELVYEDEENLDDDDFVVPTANYNDKVGEKRQREKKDESAQTNKKKKKKKQDSENSTEIEEMWDSITNDKDGGDDAVENPSKKDKASVDDEIDRLFKLGRKKKKEEKSKAEIAMQVEQVMAELEIAVEDDVELNKQGKPAINKLMKLPLLTGSLSKKQLQAEFLDHGLLNLLKSWLEPLPDGSLPNINIRTAVLTLLNDLCLRLDEDSGRKQFVKSRIGMVITFLSKSAEETTPNRRLANDLINKWGHAIYNKTTRYENMCSQEERAEQHEVLLRRENNAPPPKAFEAIATDFDTDVALSKKEKSKLPVSRKTERARVPTATSMDFVIRPKPKVDKKLEARVKMQMDNSSIHENILDKLKRQKARRKTNMHATKISVDGRSMLKYL
ncbi:unnamed protein product [Microthlaspi erraticum]|uniref:TFIIS N-terminal domain-containing protein n=1 Tax=Microthlaspi erraticum TaxID=1685480 RepID=A0A6D2L5W3_9BRAS|nr:unnamed protein product [Microthlaspi erraticum]CAA7054943.1 unnamed protein product [Microthlaspi erraticum]